MPFTSLAQSDLFGPAAILRSLVLFNLAFAVQTGLDLTYLWGRLALPNGMTYATYAHQGAYPLIVTALLAAGFILAATDNDEARRSPAIRALIYLWTGQNVMLVISSIRRLHLYVQVYSLTYWRIAAFVWMALVAVGLVLIVVRMVLDRDNRWLIRMNLAAMALTLYVCSFANFAGLVADYNVAHCLEVSGHGISLDLGYLQGLGPQALPALERFAAKRGPATQAQLTDSLDGLAAQLRQELGSWRTWSFRAFRLQRYLERSNNA